MKTELLIKDDKLVLVKGRNFKINQGLVKIVENKYAPNVEYISQLLNAKLKPLFSKLSLYKGVTDGKANSQQVGDRGSNINIVNPYQVLDIQKILELERKIVIGEQSMEKRLEGKTPVIPNVALSYGTVKIVSNTEVDPNDVETKRRLKLKR
ncbi:unnamed protein product [Lactuca saligna]|uniref:Uncharacterized protein n=1 Tax=Lactuca saligna TaxID=75948 RepID=A0AA35VFV6_LACSI|nr:unnamed protein product [Lactuca saligna]